MNSSLVEVDLSRRWGESRERMQEIVGELRRSDPSFLVDLVEELLEVGELRIAVEILCDNLSEAPEGLWRPVRDRLEAVRSALGMGPWSELPDGGRG